MPFVFDKTILFSFTALADEQPVSISSISGVRLYEEEPSDAELIDHTNALGTALSYITDQTRFSSEGRLSVSQYRFITLMLFPVV